MERFKQHAMNEAIKQNEEHFSEKTLSTTCFEIRNISGFMSMEKQPEEKCGQGTHIILLVM